ncbi:hypothetical protein ACFVH7_29520 [Kitasatospora indigofera]|uniref:hypothetical protein n=1 Tax=Kitasatospora indigofera TaxID=67307 RepID=UPI00363594CA
MRGRIRTIKPEMARSRRLAKVSLTAERTFTQLLPYVDDQGRHLDHAGLIQGALWSRRMGVGGLLHSPEDVEEDLRQLAEVGLICRYANPDDDGDLLLHVVTFNKHQVINRPTISRLAACPVHQDHAQQTPAKPATARRSTARPLDDTLDGQQATEPHSAGEMDSSPFDTAGQEAWEVDIEETHESLTEDSVRGSRIPDPGSRTPPGGGFAAPDPIAGQRSPSRQQASSFHPHTTGAKALIAEYVSLSRHQSTERFRGHLAREAHRLLAEGFNAEQVRAGLLLFAKNPKGPGALEGFVHEALQGRRGRDTTPHQAWTNPRAGAAAYAGEL